MNLVVQDGLKEIDDAVIKVRESVKYCKGSQARKQRFLSCIEHVGLQSSKGLKQDVITRWNSTYLMLESALYYKKALIHFQIVDANYIHCPTAEEWAKIEKIFKFLKVFYESTLAFSGTKYPTANLYFPNVLRVRLLLKSEMESTDGFMKKMACKMYEKFGKYWSDFSIIMAVAVVLDPRFKMQFVQWSFKKVYGDGVIYEEEVAKVREKIQEISNIYALKLSATSPRQNYGSLHVGNVQDAFDEFITDFDSFSNEHSTVTMKSDLEMYFEEQLVPRSVNLDILAHWKANASRYPVLSLMARDILAIPISTVAFESAFSIGGRVLDCYRSALKPNIVQAIVCLKDWTFEGAKMEAQLDELCGMVMKIKVEEEEDISCPTPTPSPSPSPSPSFDQVSSSASLF